MKAEGGLKGKTVVVTGGSMGIGLACAEACLASGARVVVCARGERDLRGAAERLSAIPGASVRAERGDVSRPEDVTRVLDAAEELGGLDGVVHSAGIYGPIGPVVRVDPEAWLDAIRVNLFGTFLVARAACQRMIERGTRGSLVLMSGGGAATPFPNYTAYACGKVGIVRLTETLAQEVTPYGIRVNCIAPGFVATRLHDQTLQAGETLAGTFIETTRQQLAKGGVSPTVAARAAVFLLSDESDGISGRFLAAPYDAYEGWPEHKDMLRGSDLFTLRRIVPRDRGMDWQ